MQTSSRALSAKQEKALLTQFCTLLADLNHPRQAASFLADFLTDTELLVFSKRLGIAWNLHRGKSYREIKNLLKVSSATISTVAEGKKQPGIKLAISKISEDHFFDNLAQKISRLGKRFFPSS